MSARKKRKRIQDFDNHPKHLFAQVDTYVKAHPKAQNIVLEIGPGTGELFVHLADMYPGNPLLAIDRRRDRMSRMFDKMIQQTHHNDFAIVHDDIKRGIEKLPDNSLMAVYVYFPNFWPRFKDWKHRFFDMQTMDILAQKLIRGGFVELKTDEYDYMQWTRMHLVYFRKTFRETLCDFNTPPGDVLTYFEDRWRKEGKAISLLRFERK